MKYPQNLLLGAALVVLAEFCMASMGALVKQLGQTVPNEMAVFARNLAGLLVLLPMMLRAKDFDWRTDCFRLHLVRSLAGLSAMYCFFFAIINLPLADSMLLKMTAPLFMPVIAFFWLQERISHWSFYALFVGFGGVWLVVNPTGEVNWIALIAIAGGVFAAIAKVSIRRLSRTEPTMRVVFYFSLIGTLVSLLPAIYSWVELGWLELMLMVAIGLVGTLGQLALTRGYAVSNAGTVAPLTYFSVVFGGIYGYLFWREIPDFYFVLGTLLIMIAGLLTLQKDRNKVVGKSPLETL